METLETQIIFDKKIKVYHTFEFHDNEEIMIGRQRGNHVRISDVTMSRVHSILKLFDKSEIWIQDFSSKFGTLILQTEVMKAGIQDEPIVLQIGRTFIKIH